MKLNRLGFVSLLFVGAPAAAQVVPAAPGSATPEVVPVAPASVAPEVAPASPETAQATPDPWRPNFETGRGLLLDGKFSEACLALTPLVALAPTPADGDVSRALAELSCAWGTLGLTFVDKRDLGDDTMVAKGRDERTTGEIATLYTASVFYGLGSGIYLGVLTEPDSVAGFVLPTLGLIGTSVGLTWLIDHPKPLRYGVGQAMTSGLTLGLAEGALWTTYYQASARSAEQVSGKTAATLVWIPSTLGAVAGGLLGQKLGTTPGRARLVAQAGLWSAAFAGMSTITLGWRPHGLEDIAFLNSAVALNLGAVGGYFLGHGASPSVSRGLFVDLGGISGLILVGGLYLSIFSEDFGGEDAARAFPLTSALGMGGGLGLAWYLTRDMDKDERRDVAAASEGSVHVTVSPTAEGGAQVGLLGTF